MPGCAKIAEMSEAQIEVVLGALRARDQQLAVDAEAAWEALTWGEGVDVIDQETVQRFLWYELPLKWIGPVDLPSRMAAAAAELLDGLGLVRYAEICRSPRTADVHAAYRSTPQKGHMAYRKAQEASGIEPPDLDDFAWGGYMGPEEAGARGAVARALEAAIVAGEFAPGDRGWRTRARDVTARALDASHPELAAQSLRMAIVTERLEWWVEAVRRRSPQAAGLRSRHANRLLHPIAPPDGAAEAVAPFEWFLNAIGDEGVALTKAGYLPRSLVVEGARRWAWIDLSREHQGRDPHSESEVFELMAMHDLAREMGAVRHHAKKAKLTRRGRALRSDVDARWRAVAEHFPGRDDWPRTVLELAGLILVGEHDIAADDLWSDVAAMAAELGWRVGGADGDFPDDHAVAVAASGGMRLLETFEMVERYGDWRHRRVRVTTVGEGTLLAYLRSRATGPRRELSG
jgi:hypothetical protein